MKKLLCIMLVLCAVCAAACAGSSHANTPGLEMRILKIGKADTILINTGNHAVVVDTGEDDDGQEILQALQSMGIYKIDTLIITHFDKDHVGSADILLENIEIGSVIDPGYIGEKTPYDEYIAAIEAKKIQRTHPQSATTFTYDETVFTVYPPKEAAYKGDNNYSLVVDIRCGETSFLLAGDAEKDRVAELIDASLGAYDFLKVPYHGNWIKNFEEFLQMVQPTYAVITCSDKNPADDRILDLLDARKVKVYQTRFGDVRISSDGARISVSQ